MCIAEHIPNSVSEPQGARLLLAPLRGRLPRMQLVWGDSHYGGELRWWLRDQLGWRVEVKQRRVPERGVLVPIGEEPDWERLFPSGFQVLPRRWVVERTQSQDP